MKRRTYLNCGNKYQELIAIAGMLGIVKLRWSDMAVLAGFGALVSLLLIPFIVGLMALTGYILSVTHFPIPGWVVMIAFLLATVVGFPIWFKLYMNRHWNPSPEIAQDKQ